MKRAVLAFILIGIFVMQGCRLSTSSKHREDSSDFFDNVSSKKELTKENSEDKSSEDNLSEEEFSEDELKTFELIKNQYPGFEYSETYLLAGENNKKMIFPKEDNLYLGEYVTYDVLYNVEGFVQYFFDAGTAYRGYGTYYVMDDFTVIHIEKSIGTSGYGYTIYNNGSIIDEGSGSFQLSD